MLDHDLRAWLSSQAESLDAGSQSAAHVLPRLAEAGLFAIGVPKALGGSDGTTVDSVEAIASVAEHSLAAAFTFWGHRAFIQYLLQSDNIALRDQWLPRLLDGSHAGATGLSNAMKFLSGIESLNVVAVADAARVDGNKAWVLDGSVPWCTNLRADGFIVAIAVEREDGEAPMVVALPSDRAGVVRSDDLDLIALRGSNTASLSITGCRIDERDLIAIDARQYLPKARPAFACLQCGMSIGLARASLDTAQRVGGAGRGVLSPIIAELRQQLDRATSELYEGLRTDHFRSHPHEMFALRLKLNEIVQQAVQLEVQATGGRGYHRDQPTTAARRWREAAFIPIVTPSVTQLQGELAKRAAAHQAAAAAAAASHARRAP